MTAVLTGHVASWDGTTLVVVSSKPFAPGAPLSVSLPSLSLSLEGKALGSKKRESGAFEVRARLVNLRREHREQLDAAFARP